MNRWLVLALLLATTPLHAAAPPEPPLFSAHYAVHANGLKIGEMKRTLQAVGPNRYTLVTDVYTTGIVALFKADRFRERSEWLQDERGYHPVEYFSRYTGRSKDVVERLSFDWTRGLVVSLRDGKEKKVPVSAGVLDKLMYQAVLRDDLARGETVLHYQVADRGKVEDYEFQVLGREKVVTPMGTVNAVKVRKGTTTLWCAVEWDYLPVKLEQHEDTHTVSSYILSLQRGDLSHTAHAGSR